MKQGNTTCGDGGTAKMTITAEYPMPEQINDPITVLTGRGTQTIAPGSACTGGGDFVEERSSAQVISVRCSPTRSTPLWA